jgi:GT2 family glycosyltransferase
MAPRVSVVVVAYRSGAALARCLDSLTNQDVELETVVVDNGAAGDEVLEAGRREGVTVIAPGRNLGFAAGCNAGAAAARGKRLVFLNPDTVAGDGAIDRLVATLDDPMIAIAMPRLCLLDAPRLLNSRGNLLHVAGFAWVGGHGEPVETAAELCDVPFASGAALAVCASTFRELGGFTEELFLYGEDLELAWRARMRGLRVVMNPRADVFHAYDFSRNGDKRYFLERNRLVFVLSAFSPRLLFLLSPVLVAAELGTAAVALRQHWLRQKLAGWSWLLHHAFWLRRHRRETQAMRLVPDRDLAPYLTATLDPDVVATPSLAALFNWLVGGYWRVARRAL